jgi:hypothetical protein
MKRQLVIVIGVLVGLVCFGSTAQAQTRSWELQVFQPGVAPTTGLPFFTLPLAPAIVTCNATQPLPPTPSTAPVNPKTLYWTQAELPGQVCKADLSGQSGFVAMPAGGPFPFSVTFTNDAGTGPRGVGEDPFLRVDLATAPAQVRIIR